MIDLSAFRSEPAAHALIERMESLATEPVSLMEVCCVSEARGSGQVKPSLVFSQKLSE